MKHAFAYASTGFSMFVASVGVAETIEVPADFPTIQAAIDAAVAEDEVVVSPGTYVESVDLLGKAITVRSLSGDPADTIIDAGGGVRAVRATSGEGPETILQGFTLTGGNADGTGDDERGGGMYIVNASPQIVDCDFVANAAFTGGGLHVRGPASAPSISGCDFINNTTSNGFGGGMIVSDGSAPVIRGCRFLGNVGSFQGGGLYLGTVASTVVDCLFSGNQASEGGAIRIFSGSPAIINCTIVGNGSGQFGGVFHNGGGASTLTNCIIWDNSNQLVVFTDSTLTVTSSIVQGGVPDGVVDGGGVLDLDPLFTDAEGPDGIVGTIDDDLTVQNGSPALDAGDNGLAGDSAFDVAGAARVQNCRVDLGAHESSFFVDCNGNGVGDACDVSPIVNPDFDEIVAGWTVMSDGDGTVSGLADGAAIITGSDDGSTLGALTVIGQSIPATSAVVEFVLLSYESLDDDPCKGEPVGSYDYPALVVDGVVYPLNLDGTLAPAADPTDCTASGTITNIAEPAGPITFVVDLDALVGPGPYDIGIGVVSTDSSFGPGVASFGSFVATTNIPDVDGSGTPDSCDCLADVDGDRTVGFTDVLEVLSQFGPCEPGAVTAALRELTVDGFNACDGTSGSDAESTTDVFGFNASISTSADQEGGFASASAEQQTSIVATGISGSGTTDAGASGCGGSSASASSTMSVDFELSEPRTGTITADAFFGAVILRRGSTVIAETSFTEPTIDLILELEPGSYTLEAECFGDACCGEPGGGGDFTVDLQLDLSGGTPCPADVDGNGTVDFTDLLAVLSDWGDCG